MERPGGWQGGDGFFGQLEEDELVDTAAVGMLIAGGDPIDFLDRGPEDWMITVAVLRRAQQIEAERRTAELKAVVEAIGAHVGNRVAEVISKMF